MPVSHRHKTIFVHIPKTAGTSIEAVLGMHRDRQDVGLRPYYNQPLDYEHLYGGPLQHLTAIAIRQLLNDEALFSSYFKFAVVRNPWDRLVSALAWTDQKWARGEELTASQFDAQVRQACGAFQIAMTSGTWEGLPHYLYPQCAFIWDGQRRCLVDFVARYEDLQAGWCVIRRRLGVDAELPTRMKSHHRDYRDYYTAETRQLVARMFALDVQTFQYEF
jgi:chondroitin 4-sulfotransferase 11